jgi:hypothetical protein
MRLPETYVRRLAILGIVFLVVLLAISVANGTWRGLALFWPLFGIAFLGACLYISYRWPEALLRRETEERRLQRNLRRSRQRKAKARST